MAHAWAPWSIALLSLVLLSPLAATGQAASERTVDVAILEEGCPTGDHRFCYQPSTVTFEQEESVVLRISNQGTVRHNLTFDPGTPEALAQHGSDRVLTPNETIEIRIPWEDVSQAMEDAETSTFHLACRVDGHATLGERLVFEVEEEENEQPLGWAVATGALLGAAMLLRQRT